MKLIKDSWNDRRFATGFSKRLNAQMPDYPKPERIVIWGYAEDTDDEDFWEEQFYEKQRENFVLCFRLDDNIQGKHKLIEMIDSNELGPNTIVFDPFCGSGTSCLSAKKLNRHYIGIDQNPNYCEWARDRIAGKNMDKKYAKILGENKGSRKAA